MSLQFFAASAGYYKLLNSEIGRRLEIVDENVEGDAHAPHPRLPSMDKAISKFVSASHILVFNE